MKGLVSEENDFVFFKFGSLALAAVIFAIVVVGFFWLIQKPIERISDKTTEKNVPPNLRVLGISVTNK